MSLEIIIAVAGVTFENPDGTSRQSLIRALDPLFDPETSGSGTDFRITLEHELDNPFDPNAIKVLHASGQLGYIPKPMTRFVDVSMPGRIVAIKGGYGRFPTYGVDIEVSRNP